MLTTLLIFICTTATRDDCQGHAYQQWSGPRSQYECLASIEPTLDALRADGHPHVAAMCGFEEVSNE